MLKNNQEYEILTGSKKKLTRNWRFLGEKQANHLLFILA